MRIERLEVPFDHCPKCMSKSIDGAFFVPRDGFQFEQIECYCCGHNWEIKSRFLADETLFDTITTPPEVLAEKLVYCVPVPLFDFGAGLERWYTVFSPFDANKYFRTKAEAIAATVARLMEVEK